ncbi:DNA repair protein RecN [Bifidobacterium vespertilionis]|uniref:DNA repair protein RecN n=1 Tax=Bifidobacterium vespertilionis TaxID=2562524 RepID=A0A5J5E0J6_9BIFI|nr:DNA repair protein RecN [Bifidobacterium vespertilionis]KAA8822492.1 DNA repair protein RecN [Bifidobacterium vespertilionis]KAA8824446.1 DNA repair protein RecN [Bifidobacterium vespertilionis]
MLEELEIRNLGPIHHAVLDFAPIRHALLDFAPGMTAITGETGAGKSMLLNAIRLISGASADAGRISAGADETRAQGIFAVLDGSKAASIADEAGSGPQDGELFLTRCVPAKGRSRAMLNGHSVPRGVLTELAGELVTIHGQADQLRIASPTRQREFLDAYAGDSATLEAYRTAWRELKAMDEKLAKLQGQEAEARQRADYLKDAIARIDRVAPVSGEDEELKAKRDRIENAAAIAQGVGGAVAALDSAQAGYDDDGGSGVSQLLDRAVQSLRGIRMGGVFEESADRLESIGDEIADVVLSLTRQIDESEDGADLDAINERIHDLDELLRRWGPTLDDVLAWREQAGMELEDLDASPEKIDELGKRRAALLATAVKAAEALHGARVRAAKALGRKVSAELEDLAMAGAGLEVRVVSRLGGPDALDAHGGDDISFLFTPFPGSPQLPMGKSASGGELSRLMLALELAAAERRGTDAPQEGGGNKASGEKNTGDGTGASGDGRSGMTFIFDEVDAGVGGKAAVELGKRLAMLARSAQVIVVTHLAQVASWADAQFVVSKAAGNAGESRPAGVSTSVSRADGDDRVREIARMLSGSESETSLDHARELLAESKL